MKKHGGKSIPWPKGKLGKILINLLITAVLGFVYFYITLPAINPQSTEFYGFIFLLCLVYMICALITSGFQDTHVVMDGKEKLKHYFHFIKQQCLPVGLLMLALPSHAGPYCGGCRGPDHFSAHFPAPGLSRAAHRQKRGIHPGYQPDFL